MGQTEVVQFLKDNFPKKFSSDEIAKGTKVSSVSNTIRRIKKERPMPLTKGKRKCQGRYIDLYGAKRKTWEL